jgi:hypothetical protein
MARNNNFYLKNMYDYIKKSGDNLIRYCIAQCLDLVQDKKAGEECKYNATSGKSIISIPLIKFKPS